MHALARRSPPGHLRIAREEFEHMMQRQLMNLIIFIIRAGYRTTVRQSMVITASHGPKEDPWRLETMRRLPRAQSGDCPGPISDTTHLRFHCNPTWHHHLLEIRLGVCISSDSCRAI